ncbi:uncharacterized protein LOC114532005 isoform X2 [Dendronephthya gigantea]|uniref:uncharacterized protein LOC114532005 isoform X2 n=1 Tax=Dendronephthya gigantea TaxID=151771 RepID=UPI00106A7A7F|nr:uncharacterized protein LOC114532005 isoform X2 [Dendronephthya gigantea]
MAIPVIPASKHGKSTDKNGVINNRWNLFRGFLRGIEDSLLSAWESLSRRNTKLELHFSKGDLDFGFDDSSTKHEQEKSASVFSNAVDQKVNSDFLNGLSEAKASLEETLVSLDLLQKYLKSPSEENAKPLHNYAGRENAFLDEDLKRAKILYEAQDEGMETEESALSKKIPSQGEEIVFTEHQEVLGDLGELLFEKNAKESAERWTERFHEIFPTSQGLIVSNERSDDRKPSYKTPVRSERLEANCFDSNGNESRKGENESPVTQKRLRDRGETSSGEGNEAKAINVGASTSFVQTASQNLVQVESGKGVVEILSEVQRNSSHQNDEDLSFSVQQDDSNGREFISLSNKPSTSVAAILYNNYKILLLTLAQGLLSSDVIKLKHWASQNFSIENASNASDVFFKLDEKGAINAEDLSNLCVFFKSIIRYDLLHMIDLFLLGDYSLLRQVPGPKIRQAGRSTSRYLNVSIFNGEIPIPTAGGNAGDQATRKPLGSNMAAFPSSLKNQNTSSNSKVPFRSRNENQPAAHEQQELKSTATGFSSSKVTDVVVPDGPISYERRRMTANPLIKTNQSLPNNSRNLQTFGSNGLKLSKPQRRDTEINKGFNSRNPDTSRNHQALDQDDNWLCSHYKRHCYVKFECCDKFWPCHRCHNNQSTCGRKKLKSRDTKMVKCVYCNKEQPFGEFCCNCNAKFANYFCGLCLHLTGKDDHPYHCEKCGICRIHGDRSFHCDVCGVCLDVQLRGNHKCREGSAHDECCICLEDAFTGCQILPCSHKVHKECATQMIRSGITRCPICRESFAHKLERRPLTKPGKRF